MDIRAYCEKYGISQGEFGDKYADGATQGAVWQWINGRARMDPRRAKTVVRRTKGEIRLEDLPVFERAAA
jgi:hypothetical protein